MNLQGSVVGALIVVIATAGAAHGSAECNASTVADCSEHPHAFAKFKTNLGDPQSAIFRVEEDHGLGQLCENLNEMKKCIADSDCDVTSLTLTWPRRRIRKRAVSNDTFLPSITSARMTSNQSS